MGRLLVILIIASSLLHSCNIDPARKKKDRTELIEHLTNQQTGPLKKEIDSLCSFQYDSLLVLAKDSILELRLAEIREKLKAYEK